MADRPTPRAGPLRVLIAGGGVAGVEAVLALRALAGELVELELLSPSDVFTYKPMLVAEPFGSGPGTRIELKRILEDAATDHRRASLCAVEPGERLAITDDGERLRYDALVVTLGARPVEAIPGALTFGGVAERARFAELLAALGRLGASEIAFVIPPQATWSIAAYELALLTAAERKARRIRGVEITLITDEPAPLGRFGAEAAALVEAKLEQAGVSLRLSSEAIRFEAGELRLAGGDALHFDRVVALPGLEVPLLPGLPQREHGFIATDGRMQVEGSDDIWAAGDVTALPIKQGGLAAQQADIAASAIAARAGADVEVEPFQPVLRAALITGDAPDFMQAPVGDPDSGIAGIGTGGWTPTTKLFASHLGPHLARALSGEGAAVMRPSAAPGPRDGDEHERAIRTLLAAANAEAALGDFEAALGWLAVVEQLNLVIPTEYVVRRDDWRHRVDPELEPSAAAARIDARFATATEAISDLMRRIGWLREIEASTGGEMERHLDDFERSIDDVISRSRRTGTLEHGR